MACRCDKLLSPCCLARKVNGGGVGDYQLGLESVAFLPLMTTILACCNVSFLIVLLLADDISLCCRDFRAHFCLVEEKNAAVLSLFLI